MRSYLPLLNGSNEKSPSCRCCGSSDTVFVGTKPGEIVPKDFYYHRCKDCSFLFVDPYLGPEIYDDNYYCGKGPDPYVDYETEYTHYNTTDRTLEFKELFSIAEASLRGEALVATNIDWLDFGCGSGGFLKYVRDIGRAKSSFREREISLYGHDVGVWANRLQERDGFRVFSAQDLDALPDRSFDVISMIEVIEHIPHPPQVIALASRLLKPGGILLLTTGNLDCPVARRQGLRYRYCMSEIHISLLNPSCLELLYHNAGLEPIKVNYRDVVAFKVIKSVKGAWKKRLARIAVQSPFLLRAIDRAYGVSDMPCAVKPGRVV